MILKLMDPECLFDDHPHKGFRLIDDVNEVRFSHISDGTPYLDVQYSKPNRGLDLETFQLCANAYLMNENGKTIQSFSGSTKVFE